MDTLRELSSLAALKFGLAISMAWVLRMAGHPDSAAMLLFALILCDFLLGIAHAWKLRIFLGRYIVHNAFKFFGYWMAVVVFVLTDGIIQKAFPILPVSLSDTFIAYLAINETLSCVSHLAYFGVPVPEALLQRLRDYRDSSLAGRFAVNQGRDTRQDNDGGGA